MNTAALPNFGWVIEGRLAGSSRPRTEDAFGLLRSLKVTALLSLTEQPLPDEMLRKYGLRALHLPVTDFSAPDIELVDRAVSGIDQFLEAGEVVTVHCGAGLGRTGTILACYLVSKGTSASEAVGRIRALRPGSIETPEQEAVVTEYARYRHNE